MINRSDDGTRSEREGDVRVVGGETAESTGVLRGECRLHLREQRHVLRTPSRGASDVPHQHIGAGGGGVNPVSRQDLGLMRDGRLHPGDENPNREPNDRGHDGDAPAPRRRAQDHRIAARGRAPPIDGRVSVTATTLPYTGSPGRMSAISPEWVNLMLDGPPETALAPALEKLTEQARALATKRTKQLGQPDAHALRVASLAAEIAYRLGFSKSQIEGVVEGALLHDLGKTSVPDAILNQPRRLTSAEYARVMLHPVWGASLVEGFVAERALLAIRHHHEWWNGTGYPAKLAAHDIPIEARIVGIADAFIAMREVRPYRPALSHQIAVGELRQGAGKQFDPQLVDALIESFATDDSRSPRLAVH